MFQYNKRYADADVEILLGEDFVTSGVPIDYARIPYMPSLILTAANRVFTNFLREQIDAALNISRQVWPVISFPWRPLSRISVDLSRHKHESCRYRDQFLACFSTMVSHILESSTQVQKKVVICNLCVRRYVRATHNYIISQKDNEHTTDITAVHHIPQIVDFVCDDESREAFAEFAKHLQGKGLIKTSEPCFASLLTRCEVKEKFSVINSQNEKSKSVNKVNISSTNVEIDNNENETQNVSKTKPYLVDHWQFLQWLWTHQVFSTISTLRATTSTASQHFYFIYTLVYIPFVQMHCNICVKHSINLRLSELFKTDFANLSSDARFSARVWCTYGYFVHNFVNSSLKYVTRRDRYQRLISENEFYATINAFLIRKPLKKFQAITLNTDNIKSKCCFLEKKHLLPETIGVIRNIPINHNDSFFNDTCRDMLALEEDKFSYNTLKWLFKIETEAIR